MKLIAIHFARLGPYHAARMRSAVNALEPMGWRVLALETAGKDATYAWDHEPSTEGWNRETVFPDRVFEMIPANEMRRGIEAALDRLRPEALAIAGWGTVDARACLSWCQKNGAKAIVMSETRAVDGRRVWWREWVKSQIVRRFDAALCGGRSHQRYLMQLGIPEERIVYGYNVVDNDFFSKIRNAKWESEKGEVWFTDEAAGNGCRVGLPSASQVGASQPDSLASELADSAVSDSLARSANISASSPAISQPPPVAASEVLAPFFLASNRFVERKNLARLIQGYSLYVASVRASNCPGVWPLVLLGDGPLRPSLEALVGELGMAREFSDSSAGGWVVFAGFRQIQELPGFYAQAGAFVHPALEEPWGLVINEAMAGGLPVLSSRNVGAAEELVLEGKTGFFFDPENPREIADCLAKLAGMTLDARLEMGRTAQNMVEEKVPLRAFGEGLAKLLAGRP